MTRENEGIPEKWKRAYDIWQDKDNAARLLEETKSLLMAQKQAMLGDMPVNRAEQTIKASADWMNHVKSIVAAKTEANKAWGEAEYLKMKWDEFKNAEANHRTEARL